MKLRIYKIYVFAAVFEKQPFRKISEIKLPSEVAIRMQFSILLFGTYREMKNYCDGVRFLVNLHVTFSNFEPLLQKFKYFITALMNAEPVLLQITPRNVFLCSENLGKILIWKN